MQEPGLEWNFGATVKTTVGVTRVGVRVRVSVKVEKECEVQSSNTLKLQVLPNCQ